MRLSRVSWRDFLSRTRLGAAGEEGVWGGGDWACSGAGAAVAGVGAEGGLFIPKADMRLLVASMFTVSLLVRVQWTFIRR